MKPVLAILVVNNKKGFIDFIKHGQYECDSRLGKSSVQSIHSPSEIDEYAQALKYSELFKVFLSNLTKDEFNLIRYINYHNPDVKKPQNYEALFMSAFYKWQYIFFKGKYSNNLQEVDYYRLGKMMWKIRTYSRRKVKQVAELTGVSTTTLYNYEDGIRKPPIDYLYKFCYIFGISIDELVNSSLKEF